MFWLYIISFADCYGKNRVKNEIVGNLTNKKEV
jgi:hypothetical protein